MGTKLLLGFGSTANQVVVHRAQSWTLPKSCFGSNVNQVVVHLIASGSEMLSRFGSTAN